MKKQILPPTHCQPFNSEQSDKPLCFGKEFFMEEIWKDIDGYEGMYQISSFGNVRSLTRTYWNGKTESKLPGRVLVINYSKNYPTIHLCKHSVRKTIMIHRLVAIYFIPNPSNKLTVNHKDGNKTNNAATNLEWATQSENAFHSFRELGRVSSSSGRRGILWPLSKKVIQYSREGVQIKLWNSIADIKRELGINHNDISSCCHGRLKTAGGFKFQFA